MSPIFFFIPAILAESLLIGLPSAGAEPVFMASLGKANPPPSFGSPGNRGKPVLICFSFCVLLFSTGKVARTGFLTSGFATGGLLLSTGRLEMTGVCND